MQGSAHLVGSMAFDTGKEAMRAVGVNAADAINWVPDGETGNRRKWMSQHRTRFDSQSALELKPVAVLAGLSAETRGSSHGTGRLLYGFKPGKTTSDLQLDTFGYVEPALESYREFSKLVAEGVLRPDTRFQVALPTPAGILNAFIHPDDREAFEPVIERVLFGDLERIAAEVPHDQLALQWDVAHEFGALTATTPEQRPDVLGTIVTRLVRAGEAIPADVPLGYHLCYGSAYDVHFVEPEDTRLMADVMRGVLDRIGRSVERFHLPVPIARDDVAYFEALGGVELGSTELYLGLLHHEDGLEGARRRIAAAKRVVPSFGVATECGSGRTLSDPLALLRLHADAAELAAGPADPSIEPPLTARPQSPVDPVAVNDRLRRVAEQVECPECGAPRSQPCGGDTSGRPHMDRYHEAMLGILGGRLSAVE